MKRLSLFLVLLVALVLLLTSCFKPPFVVVTLSSDAESKMVLTGTTITFNWTFETADNFKEVLYKLHINDEVIELQVTEYATQLAAGNYQASVEALGMLNIESKFRTFNSNELEFTVGSPSVIFDNTETAYASKDVVVSWKPADGLEHTYLYSVDGAEYAETDMASVSLMNLGQGMHVIAVKTKEFNGVPSKYSFKVDTVGPSIDFYGSDRYNGGLDDGDFMPFGRYIYAEWGFSEPVSKVEIRFRETTEEGYPYVTGWLDWNPSVNSILLNDEYVALYLTSGLEASPYNMLKLGHTYLLYVRGYDELGNSAYRYFSFKLEDRYTGDNKPEIFWIPVLAEPATAEEDGVLVVMVVAPNVRDYIEKEKEYFAPDNTENGSLMYLQNSLAYSEGLVVEEVLFPDFIPEKKNVSDFVDFGDELVIVRGFVNEQAEIEEVSDILAIVEFGFGLEMNGQEALIGLGFDYFMRDDANRTIDGIVVDNFLYRLYLPEAVEADM